MSLIEACIVILTTGMFYFAWSFTLHRRRASFQFDSTIEKLKHIEELLSKIKGR